MPSGSKWTNHRRLQEFKDSDFEIKRDGGCNGVGCCESMWLECKKCLLSFNLSGDTQDEDGNDVVAFSELLDWCVRHPCMS